MIGDLYAAMMIEQAKKFGEKILIDDEEWIIIQHTIASSEEYVFHLAVRGDSESPAAVSMLFVPTKEEKTESPPKLLSLVD